MRFLVVGSGGREAAICWALAKNKENNVFCAPGNAGIAEHASCIPDLKPDNLDGIVRFTVENKVDVVVVGPEAPLVAGLADRLEEAGILCCGPKATAAWVEGSKARFKQFLARHNLPTAPFAITFDPRSAYNHILNCGGAKKIVIKADGLCGGKGVELPDSDEEARSVLTEFMMNDKFGEAGRIVIVEDRLVGFEVSAMGVTNGKTVYGFPFVQDHKQRFEDNPEDGPKERRREDPNPNTGGMGAYTMNLSPVLRGDIARLMKKVVDAFVAEGIEYRGFLYLGLMVTKDGVFILECNCRLGDPETQVILPVIDGDFGKLCYAAASGNLSSVPEPNQIAQALGVVLVSDVYPGKSTLDIPLLALKDPLGPGIHFFDAGMKLNKKGVPMTNCLGRIGTVVAVAPVLRIAHARAYENAIRIVPGDFGEVIDFRTDIGWRALGRDAYDNIDEVVEDSVG